MKKYLSIAVALMAALSFGVVPALATGLIDSHDVNQTNLNTNTNVLAPVNTNVNTNLNTNVNTQGQQQGQGQVQGQQQGQGQLQGQSADNKGVEQNVKFEAPLIPGVAVAPGLTSVGTYACLGSISFGLSGPMAGASFGITKIDKGCEHTRDAVILMGWGYTHAAMSLISMNEDTAKALLNDPKAKALRASIAPVVPVVKLDAPSQVGAPVIAPVSMPSTDTNEVKCTDRELKVRAGNGVYFCRAN